ncbi:MAG: ABC transporter ATP-binding protein [Syntrophobacteraceae bacterium]|nr:ABC transporter ATP-binding protein [Syntrophobacteraceae bacterium]
MLRVEGIRKSFDRFNALSGADLHVGSGKIVAVIGPNGAGKSTMFKIITGHLKPEGGRVLFGGEPISSLSPHEICRKGIGMAFQIVNIFSRMSVFENVQAAVLSRTRQAGNIFRAASKMAVGETMEILASVGLREKAGSIAGKLSYGDQKVLEIAIALSTSPRLLILDEPTAGMSSEEAAVCTGLIRRLTAEQGLTVLFCEHNIELVLSLSDEIMVLQGGKTIIQDCPEAVCKSPAVRDAYLGGAA